MYEVTIQAYSLAAGEVGRILNNTETQYGSGLEALHALNNQIQSSKPICGQAFRHQLKMPDGRMLAFDAAYCEIFGESPIRRDNKVSLYPRLTAA